MRCSPFARNGRDVFPRLWNNRIRGYDGLLLTADGTPPCHLRLEPASNSSRLPSCSAIFAGERLSLLPVQRHQELSRSSVSASNVPSVTVLPHNFLWHFW